MGPWRNYPLFSYKPLIHYRSDFKILRFFIFFFLDYSNISLELLKKKE
jgi:hypothetical protein